MRRSGRTLQFLFERERRQLGRIWGFWRRRGAARPISRTSPPGLPLAINEPAEWQRPRRDFFRRAAGWAGSLLVHGLILLWLLAAARQADEGAQVNPAPTPLSIRLVKIQRPAPPEREPRANQPAKPRPRPAIPPAPEPEPSDAPRPLPTAAEAPQRQPSLPTSDIETAAKPAATARPTASRAPPLPLGLGGGRPGLARAGGGTPGRLGSRFDGKSKALSLYGGSGKTEGAVARALRWLAEHQDQDGGWSAEAFARHCRHVGRCGGAGLGEFDVGVTALGALAFLGAGHLPASDAALKPPPGKASAAEASEPYRRNVTKALDFLLSRQDGSGAFGASGDNYLYNHALATLAVSEACALTGQDRYRESIAAAIRFSVHSQQTGGGWDYTSLASGRNDLSITGWQVMALRAAASAGVEVPAGTVERMARFLDQAVTPGGEGIYANLGQETGRRGINMVAVGLLSRLFVGVLPTDQRLRRASERILQTPPDWRATEDWEHKFQSYYYWYTATLALFHLQGEAWKAWNIFLQRTLLPLQASSGHEEGSWPPEPNWVGISGGRVYATAMAALTLETYYRHDPISKPRRS